MNFLIYYNKIICVSKNKYSFQRTSLASTEIYSRPYIAKTGVKKLFRGEGQISDTFLDPCM